MVDLNITLSQGAVSFRKIETAIGHFANPPAAVSLLRIVDFLPSCLGLAPPVVDKCLPSLAFKPSQL
jgi:hypothetical protein